MSDLLNVNLARHIVGAHVLDELLVRDGLNLGGGGSS